VALCNLSTITPSVLTRKVAEIVLGPGALAPLPPTVSVAQGELAPFVGAYWNPITDDVRKIVMKDGKLVTNASPDALVPLGGNRFRLGEQTTELTFASSTTGASLELHAARHLARASGLHTRDGPVLFRCRSEGVRWRVSQ
jgi:hypothetical protein